MMDKTNQDPQKLMRLAKSGDKEAFDQIYEIYFVPVFRYLYARTKNKECAQDLSQEVFFKAFRKISLFKVSKAHPLSFFFTIARNTLIDYYRKKKDILIDDENLVFGNIADKNQEMAKKQLFSNDDRLVYGLIDQLPPSYQEVIRLKYIEDLTNNEIASRLGKSGDNVRQIHCRALKKLRKILNTSKNYEKNFYK